jgi:hypothetical protein
MLNYLVNRENDKLKQPIAKPVIITQNERYSPAKKWNCLNRSVMDGEKLSLRAKRSNLHHGKT